MTIWILLAAVIAIMTLPFALEAVRPRITKTRRELAPGQFAALSQGTTHYRWLGADEGPLVVCVHGLTTPSFVWEGIARGLGAGRIAVLRYGFRPFFLAAGDGARKALFQGAVRRYVAP